MYFIGSDNFDELNIGQLLVCTAVSDASAGNLIVGKPYAIYDFEDDSIAFIGETGRKWWINTGDKFEISGRKFKKQPYKMGDTIRCVNALGTSLKLNEEYIASTVTGKSVKILGNDTAWKLSRFEKVEFKVGQRVKVTKNSFNSDKWHPQVNEEYVIKTVRGDKIGIEFPKEKKAPEQYADGAKAVWPKAMFKVIASEIKEEVAVKVVKVKLDAKKLHTHNCVRCEKQIFPKTMCKCNITIDIPM